MTRTAYASPNKPPKPVNIILPAYNEAERVGHVLDAATALPRKARIIVVDDASSDDTAAVVRRWQRRHAHIHLVSLQENLGKTGAIATGLQHIAGDLVVFLDADLSGLTAQHIEQLIAPVRRRRCAMTIGLFQNGRPSTDLPHRFLSFLSGQRCLRWPLFTGIKLLPDSGWSLETALSLHSWFHRHEAQRVILKGVTHAMRPEKQPGLRGYLSHLAMWWHIGHYTFRFVRQQGPVSMFRRLHEARPATLRPRYRRTHNPQRHPHLVNRDPSSRSGLPTQTDKVLTAARGIRSKKPYG